MVIREYYIIKIAPTEQEREEARKNISMKKVCRRAGGNPFRDMTGMCHIPA